LDDAEKIVKCPICRHGETKPGRATVTLERDGTTLVFKDVPAEVCANCGEAYYSDDVTRGLLAQAEQAARAGVEVDVRRYAAA
jgi:YgiT-type zinc finger domain-containing protein